MEPLTTRQKALVVSSPAIVGLIIALGWALVDRVLAPLGGTR